MVELLLCKQVVVGSSPVGSTIFHWSAFLGLALDLWQRTGKEVRDRPEGAGSPGPPAKHRERPPRGFAPRRGRKLISP